ncbi:hypothetical protein V8C86DRAFT_2598435 [Haematococcus lacustris]
MQRAPHCAMQPVVSCALNILALLALAVSFQAASAEVIFGRHLQNTTSSLPGASNVTVGQYLAARLGVGMVAADNVKATDAATVIMQNTGTARLLPALAVAAASASSYNLARALVKAVTEKKADAQSLSKDLARAIGLDVAPGQNWSMMDLPSEEEEAAYYMRNNDVLGLNRLIIFTYDRTVRLETEANKPVLDKAGKATLQALLSAFGKVCTGQDVNATASVLTQAIANATEEAATSTKRVFRTGNTGSGCISASATATAVAKVMEEYIQEAWRYVVCSEDIGTDNRTTSWQQVLAVATAAATATENACRPGGAVVAVPGDIAASVVDATEESLAEMLAYYKGPFCNCNSTSGAGSLLPFRPIVGLSASG